MASAKTKKAPVAKASGFADKDGYVLAIGDQVRFEHTSSRHSGRHGILTAIHPRESQDIGPVATVEFLYDSAWQAAPAMPAFSENLVFISRKAFAVGERARVVWEDAKLRPESQVYTGREGRVVSVLENIPFADIIKLEFGDAALEDRDFQATDLLRTAMAEHPAIQEESDLPFLNEAQAPEPVYTPTKMKLVPLADIIVTSNTRKVFDEVALGELAESIKAQGVIAPITVRPHGTEAGKFELVAGERRYRASKLAEQQTIPAVIRTLTDREFLEIQLLENLQRVDVRPADEAQAFAKLLQNGFPLEEIAAKVGKPARFVAERARLMELLPEWVEALQEGRLLIGSAQLLARLTRTQQAEAHQYLDASYGDKVDVAGVMRRLYSAADIRQHIDRQFKTHDLEKAAFPKDDAMLYPAAGACLTCPKRTGNTPYLFDEMGGNTCLDGGCFAEKSARYVAQVAAEIGADGQPVLKVADHWGRVPGDVLNLNKYKSVESFRDNEMTELRAQGRVRPALMTEGAKAGQIVEVVLDAAVASQPDVVVALKQEKAKQAQKEKDDAAKVRALGAARRQAYFQLTADVHGQGIYTAVLLRRLLYKRLEYRSYGSLRELLQKVYGWEGFKGGSYLDERERKLVVGRLAAMEAPQLQGLLLDIQLLEWLEEEYPSTLPSLCKELGWSDEQLLAAHAERKKGKKQEVAA